MRQESRHRFEPDQKEATGASGPAAGPEAPSIASGTATDVLAAVVARLAAEPGVLHRVARMLSTEGRPAAPAGAALRSPSGYITTAQAARHLGFASTSAIRTAVSRNELRPAGRGGRGSHLFTIDELDRFVRARAARYSGPCRETPGPKGNGDANQRNEDTATPGVFRIEDMSYRIRAVGTDPRTGKRRQIERSLEGVTAQEAAKQRVELQAEIKGGGRGRGRRPASGWGLREVLDRVQGQRDRRGNG